MLFPIMVGETPSCGLTFSQKSLPATRSWTNIGYGGSGWVIVADTAHSAYSDDGESWSSGDSSALASGVLSLAWNGTLWAALPGSASPGFAARSTDGGQTWLSAAIQGIGQGPMSLCARQSDGLFVAVGNIDNQPSIYPCITSTNGSTWTGRIMPDTNGNWASVGTDGSSFIAVRGRPGGASDVYATSSNGTSWTGGTLPLSKVWRGVLWNGRVWMIFSGTPSQAILTSPDGTTWTSRTPPGSGTSEFVAATSNDTGTIILIAQNEQTTVYCSNDDAVTWSSKTVTDSGDALTGCGHDGFRFGIAQANSTNANLSQD